MVSFQKPENVFELPEFSAHGNGFIGGNDFTLFIGNRVVEFEAKCLGDFSDKAAVLFRSTVFMPIAKVGFEASFFFPLLFIQRRTGGPSGRILFEEG